MSVPFSNTHLRIPRGFGTILEGLAREVLRDQPEDIPKYAAQYFDALLRQREESGMDPAEWAAKLEDRFYNNHAFKSTGERNQPTASPEKEPATEITESKEKPYQSENEDESSHSAEASNLSTTQRHVSEYADLTESTEEEENHDVTMEKGLSEEESINRLQATDAQSDVLSGTEEEKNQTINTLDQVDGAANEIDSSSVPNQDVPQSELEPTDFLPFSGVSNVDVCAQGLGLAEDEGGDEQETTLGDKEIVDSEGEENTVEVEEPLEVFPYSGLADVDVCATELGGTEQTAERPTAENDARAVKEKILKPQSEEPLVQSSLSQFKISEGNQQEAEDLEERPKEKEGTELEAYSGETHESLAQIEGGSDSNALPKEDSLVEISFEDVPEAQQITEVREEQPEEEGPIEVLQTKILEMQQEEESSEVTAAAADPNISGTQQYEPGMKEVEKEFNSEGEEMESQHEASDILQEKVDANDSNLNDSDDDDNENGEGVRNISSSYQPTTEADGDNPEDETGHTNEDNEKIREGEFGPTEDSEKEANDPDFKEDETTDTAGGDKEGTHTEGCSEMEDEDINDDGAENHPSQATQSNASAAATEEAEGETLEAEQRPEENQRALVESQPEDPAEENEVTSKEAEEDAEGGGETDTEVQEKSDAMCEEESISLSHSAGETAADHQGEERPRGSDEDTTEPEGKSSDKQEECSRPQEEEDIMDIPLDDPEANRAAAKIQAGFRGHMTRKKMKPEDKAEGEEVSSTGDVLNGSQGDTETGGSGAVERDDTSVPEQ